MDISKAFSKYVELLAPVLAHADRREPFTDYCTGLLLEGKRKSVEPMAARLEPRAVYAKHQ
jgi:SRSO17 transposase